MKYWYLKNGDVFGPAQPEEIVKDLGEYKDSLVCPEPHSADQDFWKELSFYKEDFAPFIKLESQVGSDIVEPLLTEHQKVEDFERSLHADAVIIPIQHQAPAIHADAVLLDSAPAELLGDTFPAPIADEPLPVTEINEVPADTITDIEPPMEDDEAEGTLFIPKTNIKPVIVKAADKAEKMGNIKAECTTPPKTQTLPPIQASIAEKQIIMEDAADATQNDLQQEVGGTTAPIGSDQPDTQTPEEPKLFLKTEPALKPLPAPEEQKPQPLQQAMPDIIAEVMGIDETFTAIKTVRIVSEELQDQPKIVDKAAVQQVAAESKEKSFFSAMKEEQSVVGEHALQQDGPEYPFPFVDENAPIVTDEDINTDPFIEIENKLLEQDDAQPQTGDNKEERTRKQEKLFTSMSPTVNGKIISAYEAPTQAKPKNDTVFILLGFMVFFVAVALFMAKFMNNPQPPKANDSANTVPVAEQRQPMPIVPPDGYSATPASSPDTMPMPTVENNQGVLSEKPAPDLKAKAQDIVKKYLLDEQRGAIADYFDKTYGNGYQTRWNASLLYGDAYVVEFAATKVRKEPIVYLFRVDSKRGLVTGGLNNITLDLLQK